jgi:hypothetical protein
MGALAGTLPLVVDSEFVAEEPPPQALAASSITRSRRTQAARCIAAMIAESNRSEAALATGQLGERGGEVGGLSEKVAPDQDRVDARTLERNHLLAGGHVRL